MTNGENGWMPDCDKSRLGEHMKRRQADRRGEVWKLRDRSERGNEGLEGRGECDSSQEKEPLVANSQTKAVVQTTYARQGDKERENPVMGAHLQQAPSQTADAV